MSRMLKNKGWSKAFIVVVLAAFAASGLASNLDSGRIIPGGKVLIYRGDQQIGELTAEAPLPNGALLSCDGDCAARMNDLMLVGVDKSLFSVTTKANSRELLVKQGTVYFALPKLPRLMVFGTPEGVVTAHQLILNAAADGGPLKGYVIVTEELAEIGVLEGGALLFSTPAGETTLQSGNKIILAQAESGQTAAEGASAAGTAAATGVSGVAIVPIAAAVAVAAGVGIAAATSGGGGGGGGAESPAAPPP